MSRQYRVLVEPPGTAPGSDPLITSAFMSIARVAPNRVNIRGGQGGSKGLGGGGPPPFRVAIGPQCRYHPAMLVGTTRRENSQPGRPEGKVAVMAWISLIVAGLLETVWAAGLKSLAAKMSAPVLAGTVLAMVASLVALGWAMRALPLGIAYPVWTGIGSVGSVVVGVLVFKQSIGAPGIAGVAFLIVGMILLGLETH